MSETAPATVAELISELLQRTGHSEESLATALGLHPPRARQLLGNNSPVEPAIARQLIKAVGADL